MRNFLKRTYLKLPLKVKRILLQSNEAYFRAQATAKENKETSNRLLTSKPKSKKRVLIYHLTALYYAGTEKGLQIIAEALSKDYDVFILHSSDETKPNRRKNVEGYATLIPFTYESVDGAYPYYINKMDPRVTTIIRDYDIDLMITAGTGKAEYPFITVTNIPIILINIFGAPCLQKNVKEIIFISEEVRKHSEKYIGKQENSCILGIPVSTEQTKNSVESLRAKLSIPDSDFIFGRIGRGSDAIFDPIGINAFEKVVQKNPHVHYVIVSPPPKLEEIVLSRNIPNVHFLPVTAKEEEIWSFYYGIDALAHFRFDGETLGLNITESMFAGKPIISHTSHIWNAHLEYLNNSFSRITNQTDVDTYASYMEEFVMLRSEKIKTWETMCQLAKQQAEDLFSKKNYQEKIIKIVNKII